MQLGILNKIDQDLSNPRNKNNTSDYSDEKYPEDNNYSFSQNIKNNPQKEYKASTLDWLGGQARL